MIMVRHIPLWLVGASLVLLVRADLISALGGASALRLEALTLEGMTKTGQYWG